MKKFIVLVLCVACLLSSLAGCGEKEKSTDPKAEKEAGTSQGSENSQVNDLGIADTLPMEDALRDLCWIYQDASGEETWKISIDVFEQRLSGYYLVHRYYLSGSRVWEARLCTLEKEGAIALSFVTTEDTNYESRKADLNTMAKYYDVTLEEEVYGEWQAVTYVKSESAFFYYPISEELSFQMEWYKPDSEKTLKEQDEEVQKLLNSIRLTPVEAGALEGTPYLTLFDEGWHSSGGQHLYLGSKKVSLDDKLTIDFSDYSVANFNVTGDQYSKAGFGDYEGHAQYAVYMMRAEKEEDSYHSIEIFYVSKENDGYYDDLLSSPTYESTEVVAGDITFTQYTSSEEWSTYLKYETGDGYYLMRHYDSADDFIAKLTAIIN